MAKRCEWSEGDPLSLAYHDEEWGVPVYDDAHHYEHLVLEGMQAGLSWLTVLKKRDNFRKAFAGFELAKVARFTPAKVEKLLTDPGIIRNRMKVEAAVNNAGRFREVQQEFGTFTKYIWGFVDGRPVVNRWKSMGEIPAKTELAERISKDLKQRGFKFVGPTIVYAHLQATGLVNDHETSCFRYNQVQKLARKRV
jgi:DNA-3-methyladenine glycosylase I